MYLLSKEAVKGFLGSCLCSSNCFGLKNQCMCSKKVQEQKPESRIQNTLFFLYYLIFYHFVDQFKILVKKYF